MFGELDKLRTLYMHLMDSRIVTLLHDLALSNTEKYCALYESTNNHLTDLEDRIIEKLRELEHDQISL
jgi:hypothetical protein